VCFRVSWYTAGTRNPGTTGPTSQIKFSWTDGDQGEVTGAQFWFSNEVRMLPGNRIVYYTDGTFSLAFVCSHPRNSMVITVILWCAVIGEAQLVKFVMTPLHCID